MAEEVELAGIDPILVAARNGDSTAIGLLISERRGVIEAAVRAVLSGPEFEDAVSEAIEDCVRSLWTVDDFDRLDSWIYTVAKRTAIRVRRRSDARAAVESRAVAFMAVTSDVPVLDEKVVLGQEIREALQLLPLDHARALLLHIAGWSYREIAEEFSVATGTVAARIHRSKMALRRVIAND